VIRVKRIIKDFLKIWRTDYHFQTFASSAISSIIGIAFTVYNGFLGIYYQSIWNGTICVYYILLATLRGIIVNTQRGRYAENDKSERIVHYVTHCMMLVMNASLIVPILAMIKGDRKYNWGLIPAIAIATYTFYRIVMAIIHYVKSRKNDNSLVRQLRTFNLIDSLVALLTLQNTMIIANEGKIAGGMKCLSIISSAIIWLLIVVMSVRSFKYSQISA
jgi:hypothetical protein